MTRGNTIDYLAPAGGRGRGRRDAAVWAYALARGLTIVSKDADFHQRSFLHGAPPRAIWIRRGIHGLAGATAAFLVWSRKQPQRHVAIG